ncbi:MAG: PrsW family glutamic-type intramembrane protease [Treponema sp.]
MNIYAALALCFVPYAVVFLLLKFLGKEKITVELLATLSGLLSVLPITFLQFYIGGFPFFNKSSWSGQLFKTILFNGFVEEVLKMLVMFVLFLLLKKKLTLANFFGCAILCGLSLGCFESAVYFLQHLQHANNVGAYLVYEEIFMRMFTADFVHMFCAGLSGLFIWSVRQHKADILAIIYAVLLHGLYNFFILYDSYFWFAIAAVLFAAIQCRLRYTIQAAEKPLIRRKRNRT